MAFDSALGYYPEAELVFGLVSPIGIDYRPVVSTLKNYLEQFSYRPREVKISEEFESVIKLLDIELSPDDRTGQVAGMWRKIRQGDAICRSTQKKDVLALIATAMIERGRQRETDGNGNVSTARAAHIVISLKRPQEVATLRRIYGPGFFLIGLATNDSERERYFNERGFSPDERTELVNADAAEKDDYGQRTRDTFFLSDVFISLEKASTDIARFLDLIFGSPFLTPRFEERSMYLAYAASLSSGDLARQVGAALMNRLGDCLGLGWNDVPKANGGLYEADQGPYRDMDLGEDSNDVEKHRMAVSIIRAIDPSISEEDAALSARDRLASTGFFDITEFGRPVHAEMAAILACLRTGRTSVGATLFVTTFPCHTCTRHIITSGIRRVYYIEPYTKSKALKLHGDACTEAQEEDDKIPFTPFIGVGPRRYLDLFSLSLGTGYPIERKKNGKKLEWKRSTAAPRLQMAPVSYLVREQLASTSLKDLLSGGELASQNQETK